MPIVKLVGGLGNQMFQYAFAYTLSKKNNTQLKLDISAFDSSNFRQYELHRYCIIGEIASIEESTHLKYKKESLLAKTFRKFARQPKPLTNNFYQEPSFQFDKVVFSLQGNIYFDGYWQSEKYFQEYRDDLLKLFTLKESIHAKSLQYQQKILSGQSVSLHVRRGDYVSNLHTNSVHGTCDLDYYRHAVSFIESKVLKPHFFIFSDDLVWAKKNLDFIDHKTFVEFDQVIPEHEEMMLMSLCKHNIIANSSFSWWGAWLNKDLDKTVIAPQRWFQVNIYDTCDLLPSSWVTM